MTKTNLLEGRVVLTKVNSPINGELIVIRDLAFGTYIHGGGLPQSGGLAEMIWKSSLNEIKSQEFAPKKVLIVGLGGGSIAKLVRKNWPKAEITGVDIDETIVALGKKYMGLDKYDVNIIIADAYDLITNPTSPKATLGAQYDLICFDTYVGENFPKKFESKAFIKEVKKLLSKDPSGAEAGGKSIFNRLFGPEDRDGAISFESTLMEIFTNVERVYPEANVMFVCSN